MIQRPDGGYGSEPARLSPLNASSFSVFVSHFFQGSIAFTLFPSIILNMVGKTG
jgi:hypothetical protein